MAYGKIKADTFVYDNSGSDVEVTLSSLGNKVDSANPTFTGTVTIPTPTSGDNSTKAASTAFVVAGFAAKADPTFTGTINGAALTLSGNLTVNGTTTTIDSTTLNVEDKNIELGKVSTPTDTTADGGGITLKGATDKEIKWVDADDSWTFNQHIKLPDNKIIQFGDDNDFFVKHDNTNAIIQSGTGELQIKNTANTALKLYTNNNVRVTIANDGHITTSNSISDDKGDVRSIPLSAQTSAYVLVASDAGKATHISTGGVTVNNSVFSAGDAVTIINNSGSDQTITQGSGFTLHNSADASSGNRTLAGRGMATIWFGAANYGYISGAGLS